MAFCGYLKQSTTVTIQLGPFVDEDDGKTGEEGLTIEDTDVYLSKNGGAQANPNDTNNASHDDNAYYTKQLNGTDTGTLGLLTVVVHESGALPVRQDYLVVRSDWYDTMCSTDYLQVDVIQIEGGDATDAINTQCDTALSDYDPPTKAEMDTAHALLATSAALTTVDTVVDGIKAVTDALPDSGALSSLATAAALTTVDTVVDAIKAVTDNLPDSGALSSLATAAALATVDANVDAILADTGTDGVVIPDGAITAAKIGADAITSAKIADDAITADHLASSVISALTGAGTGANEHTVTITDENDDPVPECDVWVTSDASGDTILASGETDNDGEVTFYLDTGTVYVWAQKAGYNITNPTTVTIS